MHVQAILQEGFKGAPTEKNLSVVALGEEELEESLAVPANTEEEERAKHGRMGLTVLMISPVFSRDFIKIKR
jgi:hypothetical protein